MKRKKPDYETLILPVPADIDKAYVAKRGAKQAKANERGLGGFAPKSYSERKREALSQLTKGHNEYLNRGRRPLPPMVEGRCNWPKKCYTTKGRADQSDKGQRCRMLEGRCPWHKGPPPVSLV